MTVPRSMKVGRPLPAAKRMRLSKTGELRALSRLMAEHAPEGQRETWLRISDLWRFQMELIDVELNETTQVSVDNDFGEASPGVELDPETTRAIYAGAWTKLEEQLVEANAAYNNADEGDQWDRARKLRDSLQAATNYADLIVTMTAVPVPDTPEED